MLTKLLIALVAASADAAYLRASSEGRRLAGHGGHDDGDCAEMSGELHWEVICLIRTRTGPQAPRGWPRRASYVQGFPESAKPLDLGFVRMAN